MKTVLTNADIKKAAYAVYLRAVDLAPENKPIRLYGVPRGGIPAAYAIAAVASRQTTVVDSAENADIIIDDIVDSGRTKKRYLDAFNKPFLALYERGLNHDGNWLVFPWEGTAESSVEDAVVRLIQYAGDDASRGGLVETPGRVARAWQHWCRGYHTDIPALFKTFEDGAKGYDEMVIVRDIPFYSHCEHHMAPFFGTASVGYIPHGRVVGLSKLSRVLDAYAARLQVQERLTCQFADAIDEHLTPEGVGVVITARHLCMEARGVCKQGHETITSAVRGALRTNPSARAEFLHLVNAGNV